jgi:hypothetical protein
MLAVVLLLACAFVLIHIGTSLAVVVELSSRNIIIGTPVGSATTTHTFNFDFTNATPVGSIEFQYCLSPLQVLPCVAPNRLDVSNVAIAAQSGSTGFSIFTKTANDIIISRAPTVNANGTTMIKFSNAVNPSDIGTFYVRILAYTTQDATGPDDAFGAVAAAITQGISINTIVPPILNFCVGITIPGDCSTATDNLVELGYLSASKASAGTSQMQIGTNAAFGATITAYGDTMTSGNNTIAALATPTPSAPGTSQFGINLRKNTDPAVGLDPNGTGVIQPSSEYNTPDEYKFKDSDVVASSTGTTNTRTFTVSYLVNISPNQAAGVYNTTVTYVATSTF